jgi:hypothetical protein
MPTDTFAPVNPALIDVRLPVPHDGYPDDIAKGDTIDVLKDCCGAASRDFPKELWVEPDVWPDWARDNDKYHTWGFNYVDRFTNQNPTHECTCHSFRANFEAARNRARGVIFTDGPKKDFRYPESAEFGSVWVSPLSVYDEANPQQRGGAGVRQVLEIGCRRGFLPETKQPREYGFKHAIHGTTGQGGINQASGPWVPVSRLPAGWEETAAKFKPLEVIFPESWEQAVCLVLHGLLVSVGRAGHAVPWAFYNIKEQVMGYIDSYDVVRYDSLRTVKSAWQGSFAIATVTTPSDWLKPAE